MLKRVKTKGEAVQLLKVHMQNAENILRNLIKANSRKRFFAMMGDWLNLITNIPNEKMRETLYNIEAYRSDAVGIGSDSQKQSAPKQEGGLKGLASKGINQNTKTSGSSNLVGNSSSSLTGKNPFAILKASAIASS